MEHILFLVSIFVLLFTLLLSIFSSKYREGSKIKPIYFLICGAFLSVYIVMLYVDYKPLVHGAESTPFLALFHTIQVMLAGYDFEVYDSFIILIYIPNSNAFNLILSLNLEIGI